MGQQLLTQLELPFHALFAGGSESSTAGTFTAGTFTPVLRSESSRVRKFPGGIVPGVELSLPGANGLGSEKSSYHQDMQD